MRKMVILLIVITGCNKVNTFQKQDLEFVTEADLLQEGKIGLKEEQFCDDFFSELNQKRFKELAYEKSTSTIEGKDSLGNKIVGLYMLFYISQSREIRYLGDLKVVFHEMPWRRFSDDEYWFYLRLIDSGFRINDLLYVGQKIDNVKEKIILKELESGVYFYESDCEELQLKVDGNGEIIEIILQRNFQD